MACHQGFSGAAGVGLETHTQTRTQTHTKAHTHFVLGPAPLLAGWQYGSITNEGHPGCANRPQSLGRRGTNALPRPRSCDSGELIIAQESQKRRHTPIK